MHDKVRFDVILNRLFYSPGQCIQGKVTCHSQKPICVDLVQGRLKGEAVSHFFTKDHKTISKARILMDEKCELWRHCTLNEMLGLDKFDENENKENSCSTSAEFSGTASFPVSFRIPADAPPTFHCVGSPITINYTLEIALNFDGKTVATHEEGITIVSTQLGRRSLVQAPVSISKTLQFPKDRSIFVEFIVQSDVFSTTDRVDVCINIHNRWKQSLKYVHMNIVRRIQTDDSEVVLIDTTGVGLPAEKQKVSVGESFSFRPRFNVPALPPNSAVSGLMSADYSLKLVVGRARNFLLGSIEMPITIVTMPADENCKFQQDVLVDISTTSEPVKHLMPVFA